MPSTKGYHSYHGKTGAGRIILIVLLCLILFAAIGFLIVQRFAVYGADGSVRFELPWGRKMPDSEQTQTPDPSTPDKTGELEIVVDEPEQTAPAELHAVELNESVLRGSAETALAGLAENVNAVAVRVKNTRGELLYNSQLSAAAEAGAVAGSSISRAAIDDLTGSGYYTVARISALHDSLYSYAHMTDAAILQLNHPGYIWYDPDSSFYLAPEKPLARQYLADIAQECAQMGFDELLFDSFGYPPGGRLSNIDTSGRTMSMQEALSLLADELRESVKEQRVRLSVELDAETVLAGGNEKTGQSLPLLAEKFDRIYVRTTAEELPALRSAVEPYEVELVPILTEAGDSGSYLVSAQN